MTTSLKRVWAVRNGDWIEFRAGVKAPKPIRSQIVRTGEREEDRWDYIAKPPFEVKTTIMVPYRIVLKQVYFDGGRLLGSCRFIDYSHNAKAFGLDRLGKDRMVELPAEFARMILDAKWRKRNLQ